MSSRELIIILLVMLGVSILSGIAANRAFHNGNISITIDKINNFEEQEKLNLENAVGFLEGTINSVCFKKRLHDHLLKEKLYNKHTLDFEMYDGSSTKGFTQLNSNLIHLNRVWYTNATMCMMVSNLAHELAHTLGYDHKSLIPEVLGKKANECCLR